jgi:arsenite oxidase large subunit
MDGYNQHADGGKYVTYERLRAMGTNGFQEPATDFEDGKIIGTKCLYADGKFGKDGKAKFMATQWRGLEAPGKQQEKEKFPYLVNNGRANHLWQSIYLDQYNDFVMDRWPLPFLELHPDDMKELGLRAGDLVEVYNDNARPRRWRSRGRRPNGSKASCSSPTRPGRWETSPQKGSTN